MPEDWHHEKGKTDHDCAGCHEKGHRGGKPFRRGAEP